MNFTLFNFTLNVETIHTRLYKIASNQNYITMKRNVKIDNVKESKDMRQYLCEVK